MGGLSGETLNDVGSDSLVTIQACSTRVFESLLSSRLRRPCNASRTPRIAVSILGDFLIADAARYLAISRQCRARERVSVVYSVWRLLLPKRSLYSSAPRPRSTTR